MADRAVAQADAALPFADAPPYWQAITRDELAAACVAALPSDLDDVAPGWTLASFAAADRDGGRFPRWGWVQGPFAICVDFLDDETMTGDITHLPTGALISRVAPKEDAAHVVALIAPLADWATVTADDSPNIPIARCLGEAGFERLWVSVGDGNVPVLVRTAVLQ